MVSLTLDGVEIYATERGQISWFNRDKRFGRIDIQGSDEQIWFHENDLYVVDVRDDVELSLNIPCTPAMGGTDELPQIGRGAHVMFVRSQGRDNRPKASPWWFVSQYNAGARALQEAELLRLKQRYPEVFILWNGGWEKYLIDPTSVRDMTPVELAYHAEGNARYWTEVQTPTVPGSWLRGVFLRKNPKVTIEANQCIQIIRHLGGGD